MNISMNIQSSLGCDEILDYDEVRSYLKTKDREQSKIQAQYEQLKRFLEKAIEQKRLGRAHCQESLIINSILDGDNEHPDLVAKVLNNWGFDNNYLNKILARSINAQKFEIASLAVQHGADPNFPVKGLDLESLSPFHAVIENPLSLFYRREVCRLVQSLFKHDVNPNLQIHSKYTALMEIVDDKESIKELCDEFTYYFKRLSKLLITSGADIHIETSDGKTAMSIGLQAGNLDCVEYMEKIASQRDNLFQRLQEGNKIAFKKRSRISRRHVRDIKGNNPLYHALLYGNKRVARKLLALWPELLLQKNFEGISIVDIMSNPFGRPGEAQKIIETLITCGSS
jgi:ankyrin repeat protein